jgi:hypothetical protein
LQKTRHLRHGLLSEKQQVAVRNTLAQMAAHGMSISSGAIQETVRFRAEFSCELLQVRFDAFVEGAELNSLRIDHEVGAAILEDVELARSYLVSNAKSSLPGDLLAPQRRLLAPEVLDSLITERLESATGNLMAKFRLQIEREILKSQRTEGGKQPSVTNIYHLTGNNPRVNVNSVDNSTNVTTLSADEVFSELRKQLDAGIVQEDLRAEVLASLEELQGAQNAPGFARRYTEFVSVAADHMELIAPFIPALTEMLRKVIGG